jgi:hypothetical protein
MFKSGYPASIPIKGCLTVKILLEVDHVEDFYEDALQALG